VLEEDIETELEAWERRTRGYQVWDFPVELEPPYSALLEQFRGRQAAPIDDGKKPSIFGMLWGTPAPGRSPTPKSLPATPRRYAEREDLAELQLVLPYGFVVKASFALELISSLHNLSGPLGFELIGTPAGIVVQICCGLADEGRVSECIRSYFPEVKIRQKQSFLSSLWNAESRYACMIDFGLSEYSIRPLRSDPHLDTDPLIGVIGSLNELQEDELAVVQVLFHPSYRPWGKDLWELAHCLDSLKAIQPLIRTKFSEPLFATVIRIATLADSPERSFERARSVGGALISATRSDGNELIPLENDDYPDELHAQDIVERTTHRSGMLLNQSELLTLAHLPSASVRSDRLSRQDTRTRQAPASVRSGSLELGINDHDDEESTVFLNVEQRLRHTYVIGASGTGKSTLLLSMISQDIEQGHGVAVLDPHGDLVDDVLSRIPEHRLSDVVLIDPADEEFPVALNILSAHSELERVLLSSDLVGVFRRLSTSWGDQMTSVLGNAVLAFLESSEGGTLLDLRRFLVDAEFRKRFLTTVTDPEVVYFWQREFTLLKGVPQAPLLTRLDTFLRPKLIRYMVAQKHDRLDFRAAMDKRKIILARLSQGAIGEDNSFLLGSLLVAKINQAAVSRQQQEQVKRVPFFLYIDEFHNFITPSISSILSGARKYGLGLTLAHQDLRQLKSRSEDVFSAVLGNAHTRVVFRVGDQDARTLADGFSFFEAQDLQSLAVGNAVARVEQASFDFNVRTAQVDPVDEEEARELRKSARAFSRSMYASPKREIEELLRAQSAPQSGPTEVAAFGKAKPSAKAPDMPAASPNQPIPKPPPSAPSPGRGGPQHKYLQALLKRSAEDRGFRASLERSVLDGHGHVDVAIERDGVSIGCEISVSTDVEHEAANLSKCIAAGFDYAVLVSSEKKTLSSARTSFENDASFAKMRFLTPDAFIAFLDELDVHSQSTSKTVRGYKVNVKYRAVNEKDKHDRERMLADVISQSLRRTKRK
jgi:Type IV secretory pathway, VirD4 components